MSRFIFTISIILLLSGGATAGTIKVPANYATIQAGITAAFPGDTVLVADGTYYENIDFKGKAITVASYFLIDGDTTYINSTIIDGSKPGDPNKGSVVSFVSGEDTTSVICGFTITGGTGTLYDATYRAGGGIYCNNSGARIAHNKIVSNKVIHSNECDGGGIGCWPHNNLSSKYLIVDHNVVESNSIASSNGDFLNGGGITIVKGRVTNNIIRYNSVSGTTNFAGGGGISAVCDDDANRTLVTISGNTITHNQAIAPGTYGGYGGGVDVVFCNVQLLDNVITHNEAGGSYGNGAGVRLWRSKNISTVKNNIISFNSATGSDVGCGGGLLYHETSGIAVQDNHFEGNTCNFGGGIFEEASTGGNITGNEFLNNRADSSGGAFYFNSSTLTITENLLRENHAKYGGGIFNYSGNYQVTNNTFVENDARWGGGIFSIDNTSGTVITDNEFVKNRADSSGGGCYSERSSLTFTKNLFKENNAKYGGGLLNYSGNYKITNNIFVDNKAHWGGGIYNIDEPAQNHLVQIINNTLTGNVADTAGAVVCYNTNVVLVNTICWGNNAPHGPEIEMWGGILYIAFSDVRFGSDKIAIDSAATVNWLAGNGDEDPLFTDPANGDYTLTENSPCVGRGTHSIAVNGSNCTCPDTDYNGNPRPNPMDEFVDMGALESEFKFNPTGIEAITNVVPKKFLLGQNYPNPFNPATTIEFALPQSAFVTLKVYNLLGEEIATLVSEQRAAGIHRVNWDTRGLASGVYLYRLEAGDFEQSRKLILMR